MSHLPDVQNTLETQKNNLNKVHKSKHLKQSIMIDKCNKEGHTRLEVSYINLYSICPIFPVLSEAVLLRVSVPL